MHVQIWIWNYKQSSGAFPRYGYSNNAKGLVSLWCWFLHCQEILQKCIKKSQKNKPTCKLLAKHNLHIFIWFVSIFFWWGTKSCNPIHCIAYAYNIWIWIKFQRPYTWKCIDFWIFHIWLFTNNLHIDLAKKRDHSLLGEICKQMDD